MTITGTIKKIFETQSFDSGFQKREMVITTDEQFPQHVLVQFIQEKVELLNSLELGDAIKVHINIRGREWTSPDGVIKYFNSIQGWRIEKLNESIPSNSPPLPPIEDLGTDLEDDDDLPF